MSKIVIKNYVIKSNINKKIVVISDIHYYNKKNINNLNKVLQKIQLIKPDFICIPGDLTDEAKIYDEDFLLDWLSELGSICKVIISVGNHELIVTKQHIPSINKDLIMKIKKIKNVIYLDNEIYNCEKITFIGLTLPVDYYYNYNEDQEYFINFVNDHFDMIDDNYNLLLCHSPICIAKKSIIDKLKIGNKLNLVLSGHMHGGVTPNFLKKLLKGKGIMSPRRIFFENNCYGCKKTNQIHYVISSGVTVLSHMNKFRLFNEFFSSEITVINLKKGDSVC